MEEQEFQKDTICIYDWDGTLQTIGNITSSIGFFFDTILTPLNIGVNEVDYEDTKIGISLKDILEDDDCIICTSRAKIYTFAVKLACFIRLPSLKWFRNSKICTINDEYFYNEETKKRLDCGNKNSSCNPIDRKMCSCHNLLDVSNHHKKYNHILYFDEDLEYGSSYVKLRP